MCPRLHDGANIPAYLLLLSAPKKATLLYWSSRRCPYAEALITATAKNDNNDVGNNSKGDSMSSETNRQQKKKKKHKPRGRPKKKKKKLRSTVVNLVTTIYNSINNNNITTTIAYHVPKPKSSVNTTAQTKPAITKTLPRLWRIR